MKISYKKQVDKLNSKINKYTVFAFCVSIILLIGLLYLFLEEDHFINLTYLIVPVVALASLYIVYLSIDVMQAGNKFAEGMLGYERLKNEISSLTKRGEQRLFRDHTIRDIQNYLSIDVSIVTYLNFPYFLNSILEDVRNHNLYRTYLIMAQNAQSVSRERFEETNSFVNCLMNFEESIEELYQYYMRVSIEYTEVALEKECVDIQKRELFFMLDSLSSNYIDAAKGILEGKPDHLTDLTQMQTFSVYFQSGMLKDVRNLYQEKLLTPYNIIYNAKLISGIYNEDKESPSMSDNDQISKKVIEL